MFAMAVTVMRPIIGIAAEEQSKVGFDLTRFGMGIALKEHISWRSDKRTLLKTLRRNRSAENKMSK